MTEEGIRYAVQNEKIKGIYVIPDYHNPTSHIMSLKTRKMIAALAREKHILVIEDGINNLLTENPLPPIASFAPEQVIYLSSLSKTIAAGLRTAFCPCAGPVSPLPGHHPLFHEYFHLPTACSRIRGTDCRWDCR